MYLHLFHNDDMQLPHSKILWYRFEVICKRNIFYSYWFGFGVKENPPFWGGFFIGPYATELTSTYNWVLVPLGER